MFDFEAQKVRVKASDNAVIAFAVVVLVLLGAGYVATSVFGGRQVPRDSVEQRQAPMLKAWRPTIRPSPGRCA